MLALRRIINRLSERELNKVKNNWRILAIVPLFTVLLVTLVFAVITYTVDCPIGDDFEHIDILKKFLEGDISFFGDIWRQHGDHRPVTMRMVRLLFLGISSGNPIYENLFSVGVAMVIFLIIAHEVVTSHKSLGLKNFSWVVIFAMVMVFSPVQFENFLWAHQTSWFVANMAVIVAIFFLGRYPVSLLRYILAILFSVLATYSNGTGLIVWPLGLIAIAILPAPAPSPKFGKALRIAVWLASGSICLLAYFWQYSTISHQPATKLFLNANLTPFIKYVFGYLGAPMAAGSAFWAIVWGAVAVSLFLISILCWLINLGTLRDSNGNFMPWFLLGLFSIMNAILCSLSRIGSGWDQSLASRYTTVSLLIWISLSVTLNLNIGANEAFQPKLPERRQTLLRPDVMALAAILIMVAISSGYYAMQAWPSWRNYQNAIRDQMLTGNYDKMAPPQDFSFLKERDQMLKELKLHPFRNQSP